MPCDRIQSCRYCQRLIRLGSKHHPSPPIAIDSPFRATFHAPLPSLHPRSAPSSPVNDFEDLDLEPLERSQLLMTIALTALAFWGGAQLWLWLGQVQRWPVIWSWTGVAIGLGLGLAITGLSGAIALVWPGYRRSAQAYLNWLMPSLLPWDALWVGLLPGASEELFFRGVMFPGLGADWLALLGSSLCFGWLHLAGRKHWPYAAWAGITGAMLCGSAWWTSNLLVPTIAHITTNALAVLIWHYQRAKA